MSAQSIDTDRIFNPSIIRDYADGDQEWETIFVSEFLTQAEVQLSHLRSTCQKADNHAWCEAAHAMKSSASNIGAPQLKEICDQAQQAHQCDQAALKKHLMHIEESYDILKSLLVEKYKPTI